MFETKSARSNLSVFVFILGLVAAIFYVYWPGLNGGFQFDDYKVIVQNPTLSLTEVTPTTVLDAAFSTNTGPLKRPLSMLSFAASERLSGLEPRAFKLANVALHCANALLLFALLWRLRTSGRGYRTRTVSRRGC